MNKIKLNQVISDGNIVIPLYILKYFKKLNLKMDEFVFLMYLYNKQDNLDFNPEKIAQDLNLDIMEVMGYISVLADKGYLSLDVLKTDDNLLTEVINLKSFYEKISTFLINSETELKEESNDDIFKFVEKELGRSLSAIEIETIKVWQTNNIEEELIKEAVRIALDNGVYSLKYIDRILNDFKSRGIVSIKEIKENNKEITKEDNSIIDETIDWNWLDDEEEYIAN